MRLTRWPSLTLLIASVASGASARYFKVVVHPEVAVDSISRSDLSRIFLKKQARWPNGVAAVPVDLPINSKVRESFSEVVHNRGTSAIDAYWQKQIFSGREVPPMTKATDSDVIAYVRANVGAIGYVSAYASTAGVKVIEVQ